MEYVSTAKWRPAYAKPLQQAWNRWLVCRSFGEGWRLFSTFPLFEYAPVIPHYHPIPDAWPKFPDPFAISSPSRGITFMDIEKDCALVGRPETIMRNRLREI